MQTSDAGEHLKVQRLSIVDSERELFAYELLFRLPVSEQGVAMNSVLAADLIFNEEKLLRMLGNYVGFIEVDVPMLMSKSVEDLSRGRYVLELPHSMVLGKELQSRVKDLKSEGLTFALKNFHPDKDHDHSPLKSVDMVKFNHGEIGQMATMKASVALRRQNVKLIAAGVSTEADFEFCKGIGVDFFQGQLFA